MYVSVCVRVRARAVCKHGQRRRFGWDDHVVQSKATTGNRDTSQASPILGLTPGEPVIHIAGHTTLYVRKLQSKSGTTRSKQSTKIKHQS